MATVFTHYQEYIKQFRTSEEKMIAARILLDASKQDDSTSLESKLKELCPDYNNDIPDLALSNANSALADVDELTTNTSIIADSYPKFWNVTAMVFPSTKADPEFSMSWTTVVKSLVLMILFPFTLLYATVTPSKHEELVNHIQLKHVPTVAEYTNAMGSASLSMSKSAKDIIDSASFLKTLQTDNQGFHPTNAGDALLDLLVASAPL